MKKVLLFLIGFFTFLNCHAGSINHIVFLGDSLSDNGNFFNYVKDLTKDITKDPIQFPKSPPYYEGRFSNGPTWAENVGNFFQEQQKIDYTIYAIGGATSVWHNPTHDRFVAPISLTGELIHYYAKNWLTNKSDILFVIWMGSNDYLYDNDDDVEVRTTEVVNAISDTIISLINHGAVHFLVLNLPDLGLTPYAQNNNVKEHLSAYSNAHNAKLSAAITNIQQIHPEVSISTVDIQTILNQMVSNIDQFNKEYGTTVTNVKDSCWGGGMLGLQQSSLLAAKSKIQNQSKAALSSQQKITISNKDLDDLIENLPSLQEAFDIGQLFDSGETSCANPENYLFWDHIHPTASMHSILAKIIEKQLLENELKVTA